MRLSATRATSANQSGGLGNQLFDLAGSRPSLDLDFATNKTLQDNISTKTDLVTFTRASSGTYVGSDGLIKTATTNLLLRSEEFDNASWSKGFSIVGSPTVTANQLAAPNGSNTADKIDLPAVSGVNAYSIVFQQPVVTSSTQYTFSCYLRGAVGGEKVWLMWTPNGATYSRAECNLTTNWQRFAVTFTAGSGNNYVQLGVDLRDTSQSATSAQTFYAWGAQLEQSSTVGEYIPTTSTINSAPRFDHNPTTGESLGLLVEEQRTNLQGRSELLTAASWSPNNVTIAASGTGPNDGTAYEVTETTATGNHGFAGGGVSAVSTTSVTSGSTYTGSIFLKRSTIDWVQLSLGSLGFGTTAYINFNLATGAVGNSSGCTGTITPFANGWYRCTITATASATTSTSNNIVVNFTNNTNATSRGPSYAGSTANKLFATMGQFELGSFATSYIPTTTATVTRSADVASITGANFSSWYRQDEGTVFTQTQLQRQNATTGAAMCGIETGVGFAEAIYMHYRTNGTSAFSVYDNLILQADFSPYSSAISAGTIVNQAGAYKLNDSVGIGGGVAQTTDTVCSVPTPDRLLIGFSTAANNYLSGTIRRLTYWPTRLANSTLQEITR